MKRGRGSEKLETHSRTEQAERETWQVGGYKGEGGIEVNKDWPTLANREKGSKGSKLKRFLFTFDPTAMRPQAEMCIHRPQLWIRHCIYLIFKVLLNSGQHQSDLSSLLIVSPFGMGLKDNIGSEIEPIGSRTRHSYNGLLFQ